MIPTTVEELQEMIRSQGSIAPLGAGSKSALSYERDGVAQVHAGGLSGVLEYEPNEYTFTALAGTKLVEIEQMLAEHGQYLPFDPVLVEAGATLGGTVAAGLSGSGRYRFGGVRDFVLGVQFVDGQGNLIRGGGKVVKNAAGFDLSKFMVGSLGGYGFLVELALKTLPLPVAYLTLRITYDSLNAGLQALMNLTRKPFEIYALDLIPKDGVAELLVRVGGAADSLAERARRVQSYSGGMDVETLVNEQDHQLWQAAREFRWVAEGSSLIKIPLTPKRVEYLDNELAANKAQRVYSAGANLAWVGWPGEVERLDAILFKLELSGLVILGKPVKARLGARNGESFARRIKQALDPNGKFVTI